jgi:uncharacterized repeat protein (TIGR01451 family)
VLIRPLADVSIAKTATQATVAVPGDSFRYVLAVTNAGPSTAENVFVVDNLPAGVDLNGPLPVGCTIPDPLLAPNTIRCSFGDVAIGATESFSVDVITDDERADDTLPITNTARVTTSTYEQDTSDNADTETTPVVPA